MLLAGSKRYADGNSCGNSTCANLFLNVQVYRTRVFRGLGKSKGLPQEKNLIASF